MADPRERPNSRETENEDRGRPNGDGTPPRPKTEPRGSEDSALNTHTLTDPATGAPNPERER